MQIERIVVNASPLIILLRSGQAGLLPQLFREIVIPETVWYEVVAGGHFIWIKPLQDSKPPRGLNQRRLCCHHGLRYGTWGWENQRY